MNDKSDFKNNVQYFDDNAPDSPLKHVEFTNRKASLELEIYADMDCYDPLKTDELNMSSQDITLGKECDLLPDVSSTALSESDSDEDDLPDLEARWTPNKKHQSFSVDKIVWILSKSVWWPGLVKKLYPMQKKASVLFINCKQNQNIKVAYSKMKNFHTVHYLNLFEEQKSKQIGLQDAMQVTSFFVQYREFISYSAEEFFSIPLLDQWSILNKFIISESTKTPNANQISTKGAEEKTPRRKVSRTTPLAKVARAPCIPDVSESSLSKREKRKLSSASKARGTANLKFLKFMRSEACLSHLSNVCRGITPSDRHVNFRNFKMRQKFWEDVMKLNDAGFDFFGEKNQKQYDEYLLFLISKFEDSEIEFPTDAAEKRMYIILVLIPEAIKKCLEVLKKVPIDQLEHVLSNGLFETPTEKKARRLSFAIN